MQANQRVTRDRYGQCSAEILSTAGGYARSILRNKEDAEDAVQQAAMRRTGTHRDLRPAAVVQGLVVYDPA